jgi:hypothetical protein
MKGLQMPLYPNFFLLWGCGMRRRVWKTAEKKDGLVIRGAHLSWGSTNE